MRQLRVTPPLVFEHEALHVDDLFAFAPALMNRGKADLAVIDEGNVPAIVGVEINVAFGRHPHLDGAIRDELDRLHALKRSQKGHALVGVDDLKMRMSYRIDFEANGAQPLPFQRNDLTHRKLHPALRITYFDNHG